MAGSGARCPVRHGVPVSEPAPCPSHTAHHPHLPQRLAAGHALPRPRHRRARPALREILAQALLRGAPGDGHAAGARARSTSATAATCCGATSPTTASSSGRRRRARSASTASRPTSPTATRATARAGSSPACTAGAASSAPSTTAPSPPSSTAFDGKRLNSPNDVVVKSDGSIWFTDPVFGILGDYEGYKADARDRRQRLSPRARHA